MISAIRRVIYGRDPRVQYNGGEEVAGSIAGAEVSEWSVAVTGLQ